MTKFEQAVAEAKRQNYTDKAAELIAEQSVHEGRRWFQNGDKYLFVDPVTFAISEVSKGALPQGAPIVDLTEASKPIEAAPTLAVENTQESEQPAAIADVETVAEVADAPVARNEQSVVAEAMTTSEAPAQVQGEDVAPKKKKKKDTAGSDTDDANETPEQKRSGESVRTGYFAEYVPLQESTFDGATKTVDVTLIRAGWSANNRYYSKEALGRAVVAFEGSRAFVNHPSLSEQKERPERDVRDLAGYYTNVRQESDGSLRGTLNLVGARGDELAPLIHEAVTKKPDLLGVSINALGKTKMGEAEGRKGVLVEDIVQAPSTSTDIVTTPAAGGKFERLMMADDGFTNALLEHLEYDEWKEARPEFAKRLRSEFREGIKGELIQNNQLEVGTLSEQIDALTKEKAEALTEVERVGRDLSDLRAQNAKRESEYLADKKLAESKLPDAWKTELKPQLLNKTEVEMDGMLEAERKKYFAIKQPIRVRESGAIALTNADLISPEQAAVSEALGIDPRQAILEGESPEQWARRTGRK